MGLTAGQLEPLSIYRVLRIIAERRLSGRLTIQNNRLVKKARISSGVVVHVSSNVKTEGVIYHLVKGRVLTPDQGEAISRFRVATGGSSLDAIASVIGRRDEFVQHVAAVHRLRLLDVFRWEDGRFQFSSDDTHRLEGDIRLAIPDVLLHAGAFVATLDQCQLFLERYQHQAVKLGPRQDQLEDLFNKLFKSPNVFQAINHGPADYSKLLATLGGGERAIRQVFTLVISGLGTFTASQSMRAPSPRPAVMPKMPASKSTTGSTSSRPVRPAPKTGPQQAARPPARSNAVSKAPREAMIRKARKADEAARAALKQAESLYAQLGQLNHYELMGLESGAEAGQIRERFRSLARDFHLDRFVRLGIDQELRSRVKKVFMEINRAYHVLIDDEKRRNYDLSLSMGTPGQDAASMVQSALQSERLVKEGTRLLKNGELDVARRRFQEALLLNAEEIVALSGMAYIDAVQSPQSRGFAELKQLVDQNPPREEPYIYLGRLYRNRGDWQNAQKYFKQALSVNAGATEAQSELLYVQRKLKTSARG
ncbi:MAG: DnaJ domain-containing protein [Bradymonadia bacterium]